MKRSEFYFSEHPEAPASRQEAIRSQFKRHTSPSREITSRMERIRVLRSEIRAELAGSQEAGEQAGSIAGRTLSGRAGELLNELEGTASEILPSLPEMPEPEPPSAAPDVGRWITHTPPYLLQDLNSDGVINGSGELLEFEPYLDARFGRVGSHMKVRTNMPLENDELWLTTNTAIGIIHPVQERGSLDFQVGIRFMVSDYEGELEDEFGFSLGFTQQTALLELAVFPEPQVPNTVREAVVYHKLKFLGGKDQSWEGKVMHSPQDAHLYNFHDDSVYEPGWLGIGVTLSHRMSYSLDDISARLEANLDARLDFVRVRSVPK